MELSRNEKEQKLVLAQQVLLYEKCKRDGIYWLQHFVKTFDEHDKQNPVKPFPDKEYIHILWNEIVNEPIIHIAKSRQMAISWLVMAFLLWEAQFNRFCLEVVFKQKEKEAHDLIERAKFMYGQQPKWLQEMCQLDRKLRDMPYGNLFFEGGSKMIGLPQGPDQVRGLVPSTVLIDEMAFLEKAESTYGACVPCAQKIVTVSSANQSFFQRLVEL